MTLTVRPATPEDAPFLAWVVQEAARSHLPKGIWDLMLPGPDAQRLEVLEAYAKTEVVHFAHWTRFKIAEVGGEVVGACSAHDPAEHGHHRVSIGLAEAFAKVGRLPAVGRASPFDKLNYPKPDGVWVLESGATRVEFRGRGALRTLMLELMEQGRELGYREAQLGCMLGNPAKSLYEKLGYKVLDEFRSAEFEAALGSPGMERMTIDL